MWDCKLRPYYILLAVFSIIVRSQKTNNSTGNETDTPSACTKEEYDASYLCDGHPVMNLRCLAIIENVTSWDEASTHCSSLFGPESKLVEIKSTVDTNELLIYIDDSSSYWIGLRKNDLGYVWQTDEDQPTYLNWKAGEPIPAASRRSGNCAGVTETGWANWPCDSSLKYICDKGPADTVAYRPFPLEITLDPEGNSKLRKGSNFSIICTSYMYRFESLYVRQNGIAEDYHNQSDCAHLSCDFKFEHFYHNNLEKCVRKTVLTVTIPMVEKLQDAEFSCHLRGLLITIQKDLKTGYFLLYDQQMPELRTSQNSMLFFAESLLTWTCVNRPGSGDAGSVALISWYSCGNWMATMSLTYFGFQLEEKTTKSPCPIVVASKVQHQSVDQKGNEFEIEVKVHVNGTLEGAIIACFSYDATHRWNTGTLVAATDNSTVYSEPFKVIQYQPEKPKLTVNYDIKPQSAYINSELTAYCDANVGTGGTILWKLKTKTKTIELASNSDNTEGPPVRIDHFPRDRSCPTEWKRNPAYETCVKVSGDVYGWGGARNHCKSQNSDLAQVFSSDGLGFLNSILGNGGYWIGLRDVDGDGIYSWWSNKERVVKANGTDWVTLVEGRQPTDAPNCVYMQNSTWYTQDCSHQFRALCEIPPPGHIPLDGEFIKLNIGGKMRSVIAMTVNLFLRSATLVCKVINEDTELDEGYEVESMPFKIAYRSMDALSETEIESKNGKLTAHISCSANVGTNGTLSIVVFSGKRPEYLYVIDLDGEVHEIKPGLNFSTSNLSVIHSEETGPNISVTATLEIGENLTTPFAQCYSRKVQPNDSFHFDNVSTGRSGGDRELMQLKQDGDSWSGSHHLLKIWSVFMVVVTGIVVLSCRKKDNVKLETGQVKDEVYPELWMGDHFHDGGYME